MHARTIRHPPQRLAIFTPLLLSLTACFWGAPPPPLRYYARDEQGFPIEFSTPGEALVLPVMVCFKSVNRCFYHAALSQALVRRCEVGCVAGDDLIPLLEREHESVTLKNLPVALWSSASFHPDRWEGPLARMPESIARLEALIDEAFPSPRVRYVIAAALEVSRPPAADIAPETHPVGGIYDLRERRTLTAFQYPELIAQENFDVWPQDEVERIAQRIYGFATNPSAMPDSIAY